MWGSSYCEVNIIQRLRGLRGHVRIHWGVQGFYEVLKNMATNMYHSATGESHGKEHGT